MWVFVLVKLITPPVFEVPIEVPFPLPEVFSSTTLSGGARDSDASRPSENANAKGRGPRRIAMTAHDQIQPSRDAAPARTAAPEAFFPRVVAAVSTAARVWGGWL